MKLWRGIAAIGLLAGLGVWASTPPASAAATPPTWTGTALPVPANADSVQHSSSESISCPQPGVCVSFGAYQSGGQVRLDENTLSNGRWTTGAVPMPPNVQSGSEPYYRTSACPTVGYCVGYGQYTDGAGKQQVFATVLSDGTWKTTVLPQPVDSGYSILDTSWPDLTCPAAGFCVAVGDYELTTSGTFGAFIDTLSGGVWSSRPAPVPVDAAAHADSNFQAVTCSSTVFCVAVGTYETTKEDGLLAVLRGTTWSAAQAPVPSDQGTYPNAAFFGVSCPVDGYCVAVGDYTASSTYGKNLVETLSGGTWTATSPPPPADAATTAGGPNKPSAGLNTVSCPSTTWCVAVGAYTNNSSIQYLPEVETLAHGAWSGQVGPGAKPSDKYALLSFVSCSWPGSCLATGSRTGATDETPLIDPLAGGVWTNQYAPPPGASPSYTQVEQPACVAAFCAASGAFETTGATDFRSFVETGPNLTGYHLAASDGGIFAYNAPYYGSAGGKPLVRPVVDIAVVPNTGGYYEVASDGGIFAFDAPFHGSVGGHPLASPIVGIAFDTLTGGYYEVASDGGIFAFDAPFYGSMGGHRLTSPIVGMAFDPTTGGYYEVAADGGIFAFHAPFHGSMGAHPLVKPIVAMTVDTSTGGYYEVATDGGLFAFNAPFHGSMGGHPLVRPIVGMAFDWATGGYYEVASDGGLFAFDAPFQGSTGGANLTKPVVAMAFG